MSIDRGCIVAHQIWPRSAKGGGYKTPKIVVCILSAHVHDKLQPTDDGEIWNIEDTLGSLLCAKFGGDR